MRLEVAPPNKLYRSMAISGLLLALYGWVLTIVESPLAFYITLLLLIYILVGLVMASTLIGSTEPLLRATREGLEIHSLLSKRGIVPWAEVGRLNYYNLRFNFITIPGLGQLSIKFKGKLPLKLGLNYLPLGWFHFFLLPGRIASGGGKAAAQFAALVKLLRDEKPGAQYTVEGSLKKEALWKAVENLSLPIDMKKLLAGESIR